MSAARTTGRLPWPARDELDDDATAVYDAIVSSRGSGPASAAPADADGRLLGPFNAMLANPAVGQALQALGAAIRYRTSLPDRVRELAILTVATYRDSAFEWYAHEPLALAAGIGVPQLAALRRGAPDGFRESGGPVDADAAVAASSATADTAAAFDAADADSDTAVAAADVEVAFAAAALNAASDTTSDADALVHRCVESLLVQRDLGEEDFGELRNLLGVAGVVELVTLVGYYDLLALSMRAFRVGLPEGARPSSMNPRVR